MDHMRRNVTLLATCQALMLTASTLIVATTALVGLLLAENKALATLPFGLQWIGTVSSTLPAAMLMRRVGRRAGLMVGVLLGTGGGMLCTYAIFAQSFVLFCVGATLFGVFHAFGQQYRFAAADAASSAFRARAVSLVLAGGVVAAFAGPNLARVTRDLFAPSIFAGSYAATIALLIVSLVLLSFIRISPPSGPARPAGGPRFFDLVTQRRFLVAAGSAMVGYGVMNLVMTATPLAMLDCGFGFGETATVIQWHVLAMFAPAFFTGHLIKRFGVLNIIKTGAFLQFLCVLVNIAGQTQWNFSIALVLVGLGWNFLFVGGTSLLTETYTGPEKATVQGFNDFLVFGTVAVTALSSGAVHHAFGWTSLNIAMAPFVAVALLASVWLGRRAAGTVPVTVP
jgi:MFS family permease